MAEAPRADRCLARLTPLDRIDHGAQCECKVLAQAMGLDPRAISFDYCQRVLQKHWRMTCRHGQTAPPAAVTASTERWRDLGPVDSIKAILISSDRQNEY